MMNPAQIDAFDFGVSSLMPETLRLIERKRALKAYHTIEDDVIEFMKSKPEV